MKKQSILTMAMVLGLAGSVTLPAEAANVYRIDSSARSKGCVIVNGQVCNLPEGKSTLQDLCEKLQNGNWTDCLVITLPGCSQPDWQEKPVVPDANQPDTDVPENDVPEKDDSANDVPEIEKPEDNNTESNQPGGNENQPEPEEEQPEEENAALSFAEQIVKLVNEERAKAGLHAVELDTQITSAAMIRANEITALFSHTRPDGRTFSTVLTDNGIRFTGAGENIAWGQKSPEQVMNAWMNSDGHRANILNTKFTKIGVGHYQDAAGRNYWVQLFTY